MEIENKMYQLNLINSPSFSSTGMMRLKHEFAYAKYDLEIQAQRVLLAAIGGFDSKGFISSTLLKDEGVYDPNSNKYNFDKLTQQIFNKYYWTHELRTVVLKISDLLSLFGEKTRNRKAFMPAVESLAKAIMHIDVVQDGQKGVRKSTIMNPIECISMIDSKSVLITFTQSFMPYVVAFNGYRNISISTITKLKKKYSPRFYHWFLNELSDKNEGCIHVNVNTIRERFLLGENEHKNAFFKRVVSVAIEEINEETEIFVTAHKEVNKSKRGNPLEAITFYIQRKR